MDKKLKNSLIVLVIIILLIIITPMYLNSLTSKESEAISKIILSDIGKATITILIIAGFAALWRKIKK